MTEIARAESDADLAHWVEVHNEVSPIPVTAAELRAWGAAVEAEAHFLAKRAGVPVGAALASLEARRAAHGVALATILVRPDERGRGTGSALLAEVSAWAAERRLSVLEGFVTEDDEKSLAWTARKGFTEVSRESRLALDLRAVEAPGADPPDGVEITTWAGRPALAEGIYAVACEAYPDVPGSDEEEMERFQDWLAHDMRGPNDRPEATFVALADGEVIGYAKFHFPAATPTVAAHDMTGVKREWRGRGIAGALKRTQIAWAKRAGYERLETLNELRNLPIRRLNEQYGYRQTPGRVLVRRTLER